MAIEELLTVIPPPEIVHDLGDNNNWARIEESLGLKLPQDLRDFGVKYGTGRFCDGFINVYNPFHPEYLIVDSECVMMREIKRIVGAPYAVFPQVPGLFPWGRDENGHTMFWLTDGPANAWPTILQVVRNGGWERWDLPMTTFLAKALNNQLPCILWDEPFTQEQRIFQYEG